MKNQIEYTVYGTPTCPYCDQAKKLLDMKDLPYNYVDARENLFFQKTFIEQNIRKVPQIFMTDADGKESYVGGFEELMKELM
tara:strand:+ start:10031 stop:10276 length:246 start_codon:yes stop_codon:yes gene_type:complete